MDNTRIEKVKWVDNSLTRIDGTNPDCDCYKETEMLVFAKKAIIKFYDIADGIFENTNFVFSNCGIAIRDDDNNYGHIFGWSVIKGFSIEF